MNLFIFFILIIKFLKLTFSIVPLWNFNNSTIDLLSESNSYNYTICTKSYGSNNPMTVTLKKQISKNSDGTITEKNILSINGGYNKEIDWEDIESIYTFDGTLYICPKGKNHLNKYISTSQDFEILKPDKFDYNNETWELKCYKQTVKNYLFVAYLNKYNQLFVYKFETQNWYSEQISILDGLYDFKWTEEAIYNNNEYPMRMLMYNNGNIYLKTLFIILEKDKEKISFNEQQENKIINSLTYSNAYFDSNNDHFYFITFDKSPVNYISGYYNDKTSFNYDQVENLSPIKINDISPLVFYNDFEIQHINLTPNTQYALYEIYDIVKKINYYGIIDILENKIIFNTDEAITSFKILKQDSDSSYSFLVISKKSAYKICALADNNKNCISSCSSTESKIINSGGQNFCGNKCPKYIMVSTGICVDKCDLNLFHLIDDYKCGFCKDLNLSYPFQLLNSSDCFKEIIEGTYLNNSKFKILDKCHNSCKNCVGPGDTQCTICKNGYTKIDDKCIPIPSYCHDNCKECIEPPESNDKQNCLSCKNNMLLQRDKGNCVEKCKDGYYQNVTYCEKCNELCERCDNQNQCITCINSYYFNDTDNICYKCNSNCETCKFGKENDNEHCTKCVANKFLINETEMGGNCVDNCPEGTTAENGKCIKNEERNYMLYIFIIIIVFIIFLILIDVVYQYYIKKKENAIQEFSLELQSENKLFK